RVDGQIEDRGAGSEFVQLAQVGYGKHVNVEVGATRGKRKEPLRIARERQSEEKLPRLDVTEDGRHLQRGLPPGAITVVRPRRAQRRGGQQGGPSQVLAGL